MDSDFISIDEAARIAILMCRTGIATTDSSIHKYFYDARAENVKQITEAKWELDKKKYDNDDYHCTNCGATIGFEPFLYRHQRYCYNCGASMKGVNISV